jgi:arsenite methyltransferase
MNRIGLLVLCLILPVTAVVRDLRGQHNKEQIEKMHQDPKAYISMLENPERAAEQKPEEVIAALGIRPGETIADIGAGSGFFSFRFAGPVGSSGRIYAVDINPDMVLYMNRKIRDNRLTNVVTILSAPDDPLLMDASVDRFFICNTWHHVPNQVQYVALMKRMLKPGGQIVVMDYKKEALPVGPPPEMKTSRDEVIRHMQSGGFKLAKEHPFLPYQYFLIFTLS